MIKKKIQQLLRFFKPDKIVYSSTMKPGKLLFSFTTPDGKRYSRIGFTNMVKFKDTIPVTDILFDDITGIRVLPSPFKKFIYRLFKKKAKAVFHHFKEKPKA